MHSIFVCIFLFSFLRARVFLTGTENVYVIHEHGFPRIHFCFSVSVSVSFARVLNCRPGSIPQVTRMPLLYVVMKSRASAILFSFY